MRATALFILLVVLISTGEALECNALDGGTEACTPGNDGVCIHYKYQDDEYKRCGVHGECEEIEGGFTPDESEQATFRCCTDDLCN
uniref:Plethodontid modulating factor n=1 Tax=Plethodon dunni TaxID=154581 RepID=Q0GAC1_9SALA|nr:plethodontid modulating factor [Plethodon dunni]